MYTLKDPEKYNLKNNAGSSSFDLEAFAFVIKTCNNATSAVVCAHFGDNYEFLDEYLAKRSIFLHKTTNYIDYDDVDPFEGPIRKAS